MSTEYSLLTKDDKEWHVKRSKLITSTDICGLFECERSGEYGKSYFQLWHEKKNGYYEVKEGGGDAQKGNFFEPAIAKWFASIHDLLISEFNEFAHDDELRQGTSFDYQITAGHVDDINVASSIMEIKTASYQIYKEKWVNDMPPAYIDFQCRYQMKLTGIKKCVLVLFVDGDFAPRHWIIEACQIVERAIDIKVAEFWQSIEDNIEPEPNFDKDSDFVISQNQSSEGVEEATQEQILMLEEYKSLNAQTKELATGMRALKAHLFRSTTAECLTWDDQKAGMKTNKNGTRVLTFK